MRCVRNLLTAALAVAALMIPGVDIGHAQDGDLDSQSSDSGEQSEQRPWAEGVSKDDQEEAFEYFRAGNLALDEGNFGDAEEAFTNGLSHWKHPAIHYNLALALIGNKGDPVDIYKALEQATRYGESPLDKARFERAEEYKDLYGQQLAKIELICNEEGTKVTLDGKLVFTAPGRYEDVVQVGEHTVSAIKPGYISINKTRLLKPEENVRMDLVMYTLEDMTRYERRFSTWLPWTIAASGLAILATGGGLNYLSVQNREDYVNKVEEMCNEGCAPGDLPDSVTGLQTTADRQEISAYIGYGLGGAAAVTGIIMIFLNQPKKIVEIVDDKETALVVPLFAPDRIGVSARLHF